RVPVALLRPVPEPFRDVVLDGRMRQPHEGARLPRPAPGGARGYLTPRARAAYPFDEMAPEDTPTTAGIGEKPQGVPDDVNLINAGYVADLYELYRADPASVDPEWRERFDAGFAGLDPVRPPPATTNGESPPAATAEPGAPPGG